MEEYVYIQLELVHVNKDSLVKIVVKKPKHAPKIVVEMDTATLMVIACVSQDFQEQIVQKRLK